MSHRGRARRPRDENGCETHHTRQRKKDGWWKDSLQGTCLVKMKAKKELSCGTRFFTIMVAIAMIAVEVMTRFFALRKIHWRSLNLVAGVT
jgi:hypothetical protein